MIAISEHLFDELGMAAIAASRLAGPAGDKARTALQSLVVQGAWDLDELAAEAEKLDRRLRAKDAR